MRLISAFNHFIWYFLVFFNQNCKHCFSCKLGILELHVYKFGIKRCTVQLSINKCQRRPNKVKDIYKFFKPMYKMYSSNVTQINKC